MIRIVNILFILIVSGKISSQQFTYLPREWAGGSKPLEYREIITTSTGSFLLTSSLGLGEVDAEQFGIDAPGAPDKGGKINFGSMPNIYRDLFEFRTGLKCIAEGPQKIVYVVSDNNNFGWIDYSQDRGVRFPPFIFPGLQKIDIRKIWVDASGDLFVGTANDTLYIIKEATKVYNEKREWAFKVDTIKDGSWIIKEGSKKIEKVFLGKDIIVGSFYAEDLEGDIFIGTNVGLFQFDKTSKEILDIFKVEKKAPVTITAISAESGSPIDKIWFSTLERGMGVYSDIFNSIEYFPYKKEAHSNPVKTFTRLSKNEFLVAILDSLPAIFNTETGAYTFIQDTALSQTKNITTNINIGAGGLLLVVKDDGLFISKTFLNGKLANNKSGYLVGPVLKEILIQGVSYREKWKYEGRYDSLKSIKLKYSENSIGIWFGTRGLSSSDTVIYAFKLDGYSTDWGELRYSFLSDKLNGVNFNDLKPGKYVFRLKVKKGNEDWLNQEISLPIIIESPVWQTWWFWLTVLAVISAITYTITSLRTKAVRKQEREKAKHEKELLEMEARALRAQMNPHFIFNCMNSIKALIQIDEKQKSVDYLTTFSKLIRTLFQNCDKRQISLYDEIETCRLYAQLEAMRLNGKLKYDFNIDPNIDLKSVMVPALIIQPFIENAIWHGIVPKGEGEIIVTVKTNNDAIICEVDDDGIGREMSKLNKPVTPVIHESKGVRLSQERLNLEKMLNDTNASIEIVDQYEDGTAAGTKVIIEFSLK